MHTFDHDPVSSAVLTAPHERLRGVKWLAQGHPASWCQNQGPNYPLQHVDLTLVWPHGKGLSGVTQSGIGGEGPDAWSPGFPQGAGSYETCTSSTPPLPLQRVIRSRSQSMDAMGLSNKKPNTVSTSHSGSFAPNNPDLAKAAGIVSALPWGPSALPCL